MFVMMYLLLFFFFQAEDGIRDLIVTGVQTCALPISRIFSHGGPGQMTLAQRLLDILVCPKCKGKLEYREDKEALDCAACKLRYAVREIGRASCRERV